MPHEPSSSAALQLSRKRNLVLAAVGDASLHRRWLRGRPAFDLFLVYYGSGADRWADDATHYLRRRGQKWHLVAHALEEKADVIRGYDAVWCPDDDISATAATINGLFHVVHQYGLRLAQPAIALGRNVSHPLCAEKPGTLLRYTRFVEIQAPLFSREALALLAPTFLRSESGWGLDLVWPQLLGYDGVAIVDAFPVWHTRPPQSASQPENREEARRFIDEVGDDSDRFEVQDSVGLVEAGHPVLAARRRVRAFAYRAARPMLAPALRRLRT